MSITCPQCCIRVEKPFYDEVIEKIKKKRDEWFKIRQVEAKLDGQKQPWQIRHALPERYLCDKCNLILEEVDVGMGGYGKYVRMTKV